MVCTSKLGRLGRAAARRIRHCQICDLVRLGPFSSVAGCTVQSPECYEIEVVRYNGEARDALRARGALRAHGFERILFACERDRLGLGRI